MVNSDELICTTEYPTQQARCRINRCRFKRVLRVLIKVQDILSCVRFRGPI
jgi:hypothetical protein